MISKSALLTCAEFQLFELYLSITFTQYRGEFNDVNQLMFNNNSISTTAFKQREI